MSYRTGLTYDEHLRVKKERQRAVIAKNRTMKTAKTKAQRAAEKAEIAAYLEKNPPRSYV